MSAISAASVKALRDKTGAGMMDCKKALGECNGDEEKAVAWLREKGLSKAQKRAGRATSEGVVGSYIHSNGKLGVMVEIKCETDFVARSERFLEFAKNVAMQIAATNPVCVTPEEVPADLLAKKREIFKNQAMEEGKPEAIAEKIVDGRVKKFYKEICLLEQPFIKDDKVTIKDLMNELNTKDSLFVKDSTSYSPSIKEIKRNELIKLYQRVQGWQNEAQELYQAEAQKKIVPIRNKALDAIKAVAKENGYGYVFDNAQGSLLIAPPGDDLLPLVKKKLGIAANAVPVKKN